MSTIIRNIIGGVVALPPPYRGVLGPGRGAIVSDSMATVVANIGVDGILGIFSLDTTSVAGDPKFDPATAVQLKAYTNATRPMAGAVPAPSEIFNSDDNAPNYSNGVDWRDADGNLT